MIFTYAKFIFEFFNIAENGESFPDFVTEQSFAELKDSPHWERKIEQIDVFVSPLVLEIINVKHSIKRNFENFYPYGYGL